MRVKGRGFKLHVTYANFTQFASFCRAHATNTNSTLGNFLYHIFSVIYGSLFFAVRFVVIFEKLSKTLQFLSFNLFSTEAQGGQIVVSFLFFTFRFLFFTFPFLFFTFQLLF